MGLDDDARNKAEEIKGRAKEAAGAATGNEELKAEGRADQAKAGLMGRLDEVKDKIKTRIARF